MPSIPARFPALSARAGGAFFALLVLCAAGCQAPVPASEWEQAQARHAKALRAAGQEPQPAAVQAIRPGGDGPAESCVSCHLGMGPQARPVESARLFRAHPPVAHDATELGCVACHGGDGEELTLAGAHGTTPGALEPLLPLALTEARCGSCHDDLPAEVAPALAAGRAEFLESGCLGCHRVGEIGARLARELTSVGKPGRALLSQGADLKPGSTWTKLLWHYGDPLSVAPLGAVAPMDAPTAARLRSLQTYLLSLRGEWEAPPRPLPADPAGMNAALCSACHGTQGEGREWTGRSQRIPPLVGGFLNLASTRYLAESIRQGVPLRGMPAWSAEAGGLSDRDIDRLSTWLDERRDLPDTQAAVNRFSDSVQGPVRWRGEELYLRECASCHGVDGEGKWAPSLRGPVLHENLAGPTLFLAILAGRPGYEDLGWDHGPKTPLRSGEVIELMSHVTAWHPPDQDRP